MQYDTDSSELGLPDAKIMLRLWQCFCEFCLSRMLLYFPMLVS